MNGIERIERALRRGTDPRPRLAAYLTGGYPTPEAFPDLLAAAATEADLIEVGVPFSDPVADGVTIAQASRVSLEQGTTLPGILDTLDRLRLDTPVVLMSYLNPLLAMGIDRLATRAEEVGVCGFIVPDLPLEESSLMRPALDRHGLALISLVTPLTPPARLRRLCVASRGFVYAVTVAGITGGQLDVADTLTAYLRRLREVSSIPVMAGFGIRSAAQVQALSDVADGVVVGSALIQAIRAGQAPEAFLRGLRGGHD